MANQIKWVGAASENGSILDYMYDHGLRPMFVFVDKECPAADKARARGIEVVYMPREGKFNPVTGELDADRVAYTIKVGRMLKERGCELLVMAGCMTVWSEDLFADDLFGGRILNTHPALLPDFKGGTAVQDALDAGVGVTGCTIHLATPRLDDGPILGQRQVDVMPDDTEATLHERIKQQERPLYTEILRQIQAGQINLNKLWQNWLANQPK